MINDITTPPTLMGARVGAEIAGIALRMRSVSELLGGARSTLREMSGTSWRSASATRFLELVEGLSDGLVGAQSACTEVESALTALTQAVAVAESTLELARAVQP